MVQFSQQGLDEMAAFVENALWKMEGTAEKEAPQKAPEGQLVEGLTARNFLPISAGKHIGLFMSKLQELWAKTSHPILDTEGFYKLSHKKNKWAEIQARCTGYSDVVTSGQSAKQYSKCALLPFCPSYLPRTVR